MNLISCNKDNGCLHWILIRQEQKWEPDRGRMPLLGYSFDIEDHDVLPFVLIVIILSVQQAYGGVLSNISFGGGDTYA